MTVSDMHTERGAMGCQERLKVYFQIEESA